MINTVDLDIAYGTEYAKLSVSENCKYSDLESVKKAADATCDLIYKEVADQYGEELAEKYTSTASDNAEMTYGADLLKAEREFLQDKSEGNLLALIKAEANWSDIYAASFYSAIDDQ